jgi:hypothetical protein
MAAPLTNETVKQTYQAPTLTRNRRLAEVTEGISIVTVTDGDADGDAGRLNGLHE